MKKSSRISFGSVLMDLLIDFGLMAMGFLLYYHFEIKSFGPVILSPAVVDLLGGQHTAVLIIAGLPFVIGLLSFLRLLLRIISGMAASLKRTPA